MGRAPYYTAARLVSIAADHWTAIDGQAAERGINYFDLEFDRFLNAIHWWAVQRVKDPERWVHDLEQPPRGMVVTDVDLDHDASSFLAFASAMGVKPPAVARAAPGEDVPSTVSKLEDVEG